MKKNTTYIAYEGSALILEWYIDQNGHSESKDYFDALSTPEKSKIVHLLRMIGDRGGIFNKEKFRHEGNKIYALKSDQNRMLCFFFDGAKIIITNGYFKKTNKMPKREMGNALKKRNDYEYRINKGIYYDKKK